MNKTTNSRRRCPYCGGADGEELRIPVIPESGPYEGKLVFLPADDLAFAFIGGKACSLISAQWVRKHHFHAAAIYARSLTLGVVRVPLQALKQLAKVVGRRFVQIESGLLVQVGAVFMTYRRRQLNEHIVGVLVDVGPDRVPIVEELVASRRGYQALRERLPWPWRHSARRRAPRRLET